MAGFSRTDPAVRTSDGRDFTTIETFTFERPCGEIITVRAGARSDGVSSPRCAWGLGVPPFGRYWLAGVLHDAMYRLHTLPLLVERAVADMIFLEAMEWLGVDHATRTALYGCVRAGGESHWIADRLEPEEK